ncbi:MAG: DcrB-related protein [Byssovorax sp.]
MEYRLNELTITLPGTGWEDTSSHRLALPAPDGTRVTLEIRRDAPIAREALAARVDADLKGHGRFQRGFELLVREAFESTELHGVRTSFRTVAPEGAIQHEVAYLPLSEVLLVFVARGTITHARECGELLQAAIESIRLR